MIKDEHLHMSKIPMCRIKNENITLEFIKSIISEEMSKKRLSVLIKDDEIKSGGLFNSSKAPCIVIYNSNHQKDYIKYCITVQKQGVETLITTFTWGNSKLKDNEVSAQVKRESSTLGMIFAKGPSKQKMIEEDFYYQILEETIMEILS